MKLFTFGFISSCLAQILLSPGAIAQNTADLLEPDINLPPEIIESSPVLQKWLKQVPNVLEDIRHDPAFVTLIRAGLTTFPSTDDALGLNLGIRDIFIKRTGLTISADYQTAFNGDKPDGMASRRNAVGADLNYFLLPLGNYINFAPLAGYRYVQSDDFFTDGVHLGVRLMLPFSRGGAGDISVSQSWISPGGSEEVGITSFAAGYAVTSHLRLSADIERQNSIADQDSRFGVNLEWLLY